MAGDPSERTGRVARIGPEPSPGQRGWSALRHNRASAAREGDSEAPEAARALKGMTALSGRHYRTGPVGRLGADAWARHGAGQRPKSGVRSPASGVEVPSAVAMNDNGWVRVRLLGQLEVEGRSEALEAGQPQGTDALLKLLALARGTPVSVDRIADVLWGDAQPARAADQVGVLVSRLRGVVGREWSHEDTGRLFLGRRLAGHRRVGPSAVTAAEALAGGRTGVARAAAGAALALVRGPLLADDDGEWVDADRAVIDATIVRARRTAVDAAVTAGDLDAAASLAEQALAHDPYDEVVLRALMRAHLDARRPASALAAYARVREHLAEELGVPPTAETEALHAEALVAADGDTVAMPTLRKGGLSGVVGRSAEFGYDAAHDQAGRSGVALVVVEGAAGIGKTTLIDGWSHRVGANALVLRGRCDTFGRDLPLQPVADALSRPPACDRRRGGRGGPG